MRPSTRVASLEHRPSLSPTHWPRSWTALLNSLPLTRRSRRSAISGCSAGSGARSPAPPATQAVMRSRRSAGTGTIATSRWPGPRSCVESVLMGPSSSLLALLGPGTPSSLPADRMRLGRFAPGLQSFAAGEGHSCGGAMAIGVAGSAGGRLVPLPVGQAAGATSACRTPPWRRITGEPLAKRSPPGVRALAVLGNLWTSRTC